MKATAYVEKKKPYKPSLIISRNFHDRSWRSASISWDSPIAYIILGDIIRTSSIHEDVKLIASNRIPFDSIAARREPREIPEHEISDDDSRSEDSGWICSTLFRLAGDDVVSDNRIIGTEYKDTKSGTASTELRIEASRIILADVVASNLSANDSRVDENAVAAAYHVVVADLGTIRLDTECNAVPRDIVVRNSRVLLVTHAHAYVEQLRIC